MANGQEVARKRRKPINVESIVFHTLNTILMLIITFVMVYPFWNTIAVSFNDATDTIRGGITFWPRQFSLYSYQMVFKNQLMLTAAFNSVARTLISTVLGVVTASIIAFVISRKELVGRRFITSFFLITMYVNAGLIPNYFLMQNLKLTNSFWVYVLPNMFGVFAIMVIRSYIDSLPESLSEAAIIDGAGHFRVYWQIILPLCKPVLATVALWAAVGAWSQWFDTFIYNSSRDDLTTLQYEMMKLLASASSSARDNSSMYGEAAQQANIVTPMSIRAAVTVVASVPILVVYPFLQKYFVKGVMIGAVKG